MFNLIHLESDESVTFLSSAYAETRPVTPTSSLSAELLTITSHASGVLLSHSYTLSSSVAALGVHWKLGHDIDYEGECAPDKWQPAFPISVRVLRVHNTSNTQYIIIEMHIEQSQTQLRNL
jgi:hypothetical protein